MEARIHYQQFHYVSSESPMILLTLGACVRVMVVTLCVYMSVTTLAATYLVYTLKVGCH